MSKEKKGTKWSCPLCHQTFTPADGMTAIEHIADGIVKMYAELQKTCGDDTLPCPRCGQSRMTSKNALSRQADIHICDSCGTEEALTAAKNESLPIEAWWIVLELLTGFSGVLSEEGVREHE